MKSFKKKLKILRKELAKHKMSWAILFFVFAGGILMRTIGVHKILGFYFDQGRDAMVIWRFLHEGKFFLVGPTTGIAGIFRGPYYYFLIMPFYWIGGGSPVVPAIFLGILSMTAIALMGYLAYKVAGYPAAIISIFVASFGHYLVLASRWLSNPTPMLILSMLLVWFMYLITLGKRQAWVGIGLVLGLSLFNFGSSGELFYFPAVIIFAVWQRKNLPTVRQVLLAGFLFFLTFAPLILFDIRHGGILRKNIAEFLFGRESFKLSFWEVFKIRTNFYYDVFTTKIFHWRQNLEIFILSVVSIYFVVRLKRFWQHDLVKILLVLLISPMVGLLFFQGNYGNIYDYYMTGYYLIFILLFSIVLGKFYKNILGKLFVALFVFVFWQNNVPVTWSRINDNLTGEHSIGLKNELLAVDWVYKDAAGESFNVDVYVPPVIPHAYEYLFTWRGKTKYNTNPTEQHLDLLYTLFEVDPPHPERLEAWLDRQAGIGEVKEEVRFGGITVQRRLRLKNE